MSIAVKEIVQKVKTLNGKERQELLKVLPKAMYTSSYKPFSDQKIAYLAKLTREALQTGKGLKTFNNWDKFMAHLRSL